MSRKFAGCSRPGPGREEGRGRQAGGRASRRAGMAGRGAAVRDTRDARDAEGREGLEDSRRASLVVHAACPREGTELDGPAVPGWLVLFEFPSKTSALAPRERQVETQTREPPLFRFVFSSSKAQLLTHSTFNAIRCRQEEGPPACSPHTLASRASSRLSRPHAALRHSRATTQGPSRPVGPAAEAAVSQWSPDRQ